MDKLYNIKEAAEALSVSPSFLYKQVEAENGIINFTRIGASVRFTEKQLCDYIEKCSITHDKRRKA